MIVTAQDILFIYDLAWRQSSIDSITAKNASGTWTLDKARSVLDAMEDLGIISEPDISNQRMVLIFEKDVVQRILDDQFSPYNYPVLEELPALKQLKMYKELQTLEVITNEEYWDHVDRLKPIILKSLQ